MFGLSEVDWSVMCGISGVVCVVGKLGFESCSFFGGFDWWVSVACLRMCVLGEGFQPLHWNMLSWLVVDFCAGVFRVFRRGWVG